MILRNEEQYIILIATAWPKAFIIFDVTEWSKFEFTKNGIFRTKL